MLPYKNILVPHAGTKTGDDALEKAMEIAKESNGKITILSVLESVSIPSDIMSDITQTQKTSELQHTTRSFKKLLYKKMESHVLVCKRKKITAVIKITHGNPDEEILRFYNDNQVDLIVMTKKKNTTDKSLLNLGSNTRKILEHATCPILIVDNKKKIC